MTNTTSRETILTAAENFGFAVKASVLRGGYTTITLDSNRALKVSFDRIGRIRSAQLVTGDVPRGIRPATVDAVHDELRAAYRANECTKKAHETYSMLAALTAPKPAPVEPAAAELIEQTETLISEVLVRRPELSPTYVAECERLGIDPIDEQVEADERNAPYVPPAGDVFDELDAQYAAADRFERDPQNRGSIGPADRRNALNAAAMRSARAVPLSAERTAAIITFGWSRMPSRTAVTGTCGDACCGWCVLDDRPCVLGNASSG